MNQKNINVVKRKMRSLLNEEINNIIDSLLDNEKKLSASLGKEVNLDLENFSFRVTVVVKENDYSPSFKLASRRDSVLFQQKANE